MKKLVELFLNISIADFCGKLDQVTNLKEQGIEISKEEALLKKQYMVICVIDKKRSHTYAELAKLLNIKEEEVEDWTFDAISNELIDAKVDQISREVIICSHQFRHVGDQEWKVIHAQIKTWRDRFEHIQKML